MKVLQVASLELVEEILTSRVRVRDDPGIAWRDGSGPGRRARWKPVYNPYVKPPLLWHLLRDGRLARLPGQNRAT